MDFNPYTYGYSAGSAVCWAFRWADACKKGLYIVTLIVPHFHVQSFHCVVDDFGNLVPVN